MRWQLRPAILVLFLLLVDGAFGFEISEVMFNPDDGNEWVELLVEEDIDFGNYTLTDNLNTDEIVCCSFQSECSYLVSKNTYVIVADQDTELSVQGSIFCVDDNSIGNGLGNSGDSISLRKNGIEKSNFTYATEITKGKSLSRVGNIFQETVPSPWKENSASEVLADDSTEAEVTKSPDLEIVMIENQDIVAGAKVKMFKVANNDYPEYNEPIDAIIYWNITQDGTVIFEQSRSLSFKSYTSDTGEYEFTEDGSYMVCGEILAADDAIPENNRMCFNILVHEAYLEPCNLTLSVVTDKQVYSSGEKISIEHKIGDERYGFEIDYWVEDIFGALIKDKARTSNLNKKSYTPHFDEKEKALFLVAELTPHCNNSNEDRIGKTLVVVKGADGANEDSIDSGSRIEILGVSPTNPKFGDTIFVKIKIHKGDTRKTVVEIKVKNEEIVSETTKLYLSSKNEDIEASVPVLLKYDCRYGAGRYNVVAEGLDSKDEAEINVNNVICNQNKIEDDEYELILFSCYDNSCHETIRISNNDDKTHTYELSSYVYKGSKSYSGERGGNKILVEIGPLSTKYVALHNALENFPADASMKVRILREDRKTPFEFTEKLPFTIQNSKTDHQASPGLPVLAKIESVEVGAVNSELANQKSSENIPEDNLITGDIIYESVRRRSSNLSKYLLIAMVIIGVYALVTRLKN